MMPKPPTWISARITPSPNPLQYVPVSTTTRPVTHTAEVEVNRAVTNPVAPPSSEDTGSMSRNAPSRITAPKAMARVRAGCTANSDRRALVSCPATSRSPSPHRFTAGGRIEPVNEPAAITLPGHS